ncbi:MAG: hypothetical protein ACXABG_10770 [Promethearchaeota archaeon]|jgi:hypothetical protein
MTEDDWKHNSYDLEKALGFSLECPRCRSWNLYFRVIPQAINIRCQLCELKLTIYKKSLVHNKKIVLPIIT